MTKVGFGTVQIFSEGVLLVFFIALLNPKKFSFSIYHLVNISFSELLKNIPDTIIILFLFAILILLAMFFFASYMYHLQKKEITE